MVKKAQPLRSVRMAVAGGAIAAVALLSSGGLAQADYPPVPNPQLPQTRPPTIAGVSPEVGASPASLPSTGSGIDTTLMLAGSTLLAGIGIAGASSLSRRRREQSI